MKRPMRALLPLLLILAACGEEPAADQARFERITLGVADRPRPRPATVAVLQPARGLGGWQVESEKSRLLAHGEALGLELRGTKPRSIRVETAQDPKRFNRVQVRGIFNARLELTLRLYCDGKARYERKTSVNAGAGPRAIPFDLPWKHGAWGTLDGVELAVTGGGPFEVLAFEFVQMPLAGFLPLPEDGPRIVPLGNEARLGVGLVGGAPLEGRLAVQNPTEELSFCFGVPSEVRTAGSSACKLVVSLGEGEEIVREKYSLPVDGTWKHAQLGLGDFVGRELPLRFALEGDPEHKAACVLANVELSRPGVPTPSVLLVTSDTHRADYLGAAESGVAVETPTLDALAGRGTLFTDAWSTTNVTSPSHVAVMTGFGPRDSRVIANTGHLSDEAATLAEAFAAAGWGTVGVVSVRHLGPRGIGLGQGFDRMRDPIGEPWDAEDAVDALLALVEESEGRPLFAWLHLFDAHDPYAPPDGYDHKYYPAEKDPTDPSLPEPEWQMGTLPYHLLEYRDTSYPETQYRGEISYLDRELARVFAHPALAQGWVAFTADHGEILHTQGSWYNHGELFPATLHVPLILAGPGVPAGRRCAAPVEQAHIGRTLLDLAGLSGTEFPGENLLRAIDSKGPATTRFALSAGGFSASLTDGHWYLVLTLKKHKTMLPRPRETHEVELYDLEQDPECTHTVTEQQFALARQLRARLVEWLEHASEHGFAAHAQIGTEELAQLAAMGYAGDTPEVGARRWIDPECDCEQCAKWR